MNKLPTKQIYLLVVIIVGIFALSIYSTYSIFTFESSTSDVVSIHTPNSLSINTSTTEYKQVTIPKNNYITTDVDIYNPSDDDMCYSIWYKAIEENDYNQIDVFEISDFLTTSTTINAKSSTRVNLILVNDSDKEVKLNIGVSSNSLNEDGTCSLNLKSDKQTIKTVYQSAKEATKIIRENANKVNTHEEGYLTYKNITTNNLKYNIDDTIYISDTFTYHNEAFTLKEPKEIKSEELLNYLSTKDKSYYFCKTDKCNILYKINNVKKTIKPDSNDIYYEITNYDQLKGYLKGTSGIKITNKNYLYYGDNPHNYVYYNCTNTSLLNTCELWRIIGSYYDGELDQYNLKIINDNSIGSFKYNDIIISEGEDLIPSNIWYNENTSSMLYTSLLKDYKLNSTRYLDKKAYYQDSLNENVFTNSQNKALAEISILSLQDYLNSSSCNNINITDLKEECLKNNWLHSYLKKEWTYTTNSQDIDSVYSLGDTIELTKVDSSLEVRPIVFLKSRVLITSGDGTIENPYVIK